VILSAVAALLVGVSGASAARPVREPLQRVAATDQRETRDPDGARIGDVEEQHRGAGARIEAPLARAPQEVPHGDGDVAEVDVDRAGARALVTHGAVVGHVGELVVVHAPHAAARLLLVEDRLDQERGREDLVPR